MNKRDQNAKFMAEFVLVDENKEQGDRQVAKRGGSSQEGRRSAQASRDGSEVPDQDEYTCVIPILRRSKVGEKYVKAARKIGITTRKNSVLEDTLTLDTYSSVLTRVGKYFGYDEKKWQFKSEEVVGDWVLNVEENTKYREVKEYWQGVQLHLEEILPASLASLPPSAPKLTVRGLKTGALTQSWVDHEEDTVDFRQDVRRIKNNEEWEEAKKDHPMEREEAALLHMGAAAAELAVTESDCEADPPAAIAFQEQGAHKLWEFATNKANHENFALDAIPLLVQRVKDGLSEDVKAAAAAALWNMTPSACMRPLLCEGGAIEMMLEALEGEGAEAETRLRLLGALAVMTVDAQCRTHLLDDEARGVQLLLALMAKEREEEEEARRAAECLCAVVVRDPAARLLMAGNGALLPLLDLFGHHPHKAYSYTPNARQLPIDREHSCYMQFVSAACLATMGQDAAAMRTMAGSGDAHRIFDHLLNEMYFLLKDIIRVALDKQKQRDGYTPTPLHEEDEAGEEGVAEARARDRRERRAAEDRLRMRTAEALGAALWGMATSLLLPGGGGVTESMLDLLAELSTRTVQYNEAVGLRVMQSVAGAVCAISEDSQVAYRMVNSSLKSATPMSPKQMAAAPLRPQMRQDSTYVQLGRQSGTPSWIQGTIDMTDSLRGLLVPVFSESGEDSSPVRAMAAATVGLMSQHKDEQGRPTLAGPLLREGLFLSLVGSCTGAAHPEDAEKEASLQAVVAAALMFLSSECEARSEDELQGLALVMLECHTMAAMHFHLACLWGILRDPLNRARVLSLPVPEAVRGDLLRRDLPPQTPLPEEDGEQQEQEREDNEEDPPEEAPAGEQAPPSGPPPPGARSRRGSAASELGFLDETALAAVERELERDEDAAALLAAVAAGEVDVPLEQPSWSLLGPTVLQVCGYRWMEELLLAEDEEHPVVLMFQYWVGAVWLCGVPPAAVLPGAPGDARVGVQAAPQPSAPESWWTLEVPFRLKAGEEGEELEEVEGIHALGPGVVELVLKLLCLPLTPAFMRIKLLACRTVWAISAYHPPTQAYILGNATIWPHMLQMVETQNTWPAMRKAAAVCLLSFAESVNSVGKRAVFQSRLDQGLVLLLESEDADLEAIAAQGLGRRVESCLASKPGRESIEVVTNRPRTVKALLDALRRSQDRLERQRTGCALPEDGGLTKCGDAPREPLDAHVHLLRTLLAISTDALNQIQMAKHGLKVLLRANTVLHGLAISGPALPMPDGIDEQDLCGLAGGILQNLASNPSNRTRFYKFELRCTAAAQKASEGPSDSPPRHPTLSSPEPLPLAAQPSSSSFLREPLDIKAVWPDRSLLTTQDVSLVSPRTLPASPRELPASPGVVPALPSPRGPADPSLASETSIKFLKWMGETFDRSAGRRGAPRGTPGKSPRIRRDQAIYQTVRPRAPPGSRLVVAAPGPRPSDDPSFASARIAPARPPQAAPAPPRSRRQVSKRGGPRSNRHRPNLSRLYQPASASRLPPLSPAHSLHSVGTSSAGASPAKSEEEGQGLPQFMYQMKKPLSHMWVPAPDMRKDHSPWEAPIKEYVQEVKPVTLPTVARKLLMTERPITPARQLQDTCQQLAHETMAGGPVARDASAPSTALPTPVPPEELTRSLKEQVSGTLRGASLDASVSRDQLELLHQMSSDTLQGLPQESKQLIEVGGRRCSLGGTELNPNVPLTVMEPMSRHEEESLRKAMEAKEYMRQHDPAGLGLSKEDRDLLRDAGKMPLKVQLAPGSFKTCISFERQDAAQAGTRREKLTMFEHVEGSRVYDDLFPTYLLPNGQEAHFYYQHGDTAHVQASCMLLPPHRPLVLRDLDMEELPTGGVLDQLAAPASSANGRAGAEVWHCPRPDVGPLPGTHLLPVRTPGSTKRSAFGRLKDTELYAKFRVTVELVQHISFRHDTEATVAAKSRKAWSLPKSIFGPRAKESDAKAFFDTPKSDHKAFLKDWGKLTDKEKFTQMLQREAKQRKQDPDTLIEELRVCLDTHYPMLKSLHLYYSGFSGEPYAMQLNAYTQWLEDAKIPDANSKFCKRSDCDTLFIVANYAVKSKDPAGPQGVKVNDDHGLTRFEFVEAVVRIALAKYGKNGEGVVESVEILIKENLLKHLPEDSLVDPNDFRSSRLYFEEVEAAFKKHSAMLKALYSRQRMRPRGGGVRPKAVRIEHWLALLDQCRFFSETFTLREGNLCYLWSRMTVQDDMADYWKHTSITFVDFLDALARLAEYFNIPPLDYLHQAGFEHVFDWHMAVETGTFEDKLNHLAEMLNEHGREKIAKRPLELKVELMLDLLFRRLYYDPQHKEAPFDYNGLLKMLHKQDKDMGR